MRFRLFAQIIIPQSAQDALLSALLQIANFAIKSLSIMTRYSKHVKLITCLRFASRSAASARRRYVLAFKIHFYDLLTRSYAVRLTAYITIILLSMRAFGHKLHCAVTDTGSKTIWNAAQATITVTVSARRGLKRVSRTADHSTRAGSTIGSSAYDSRFESSTYVGRLRAPSLITSRAVSSSPS